MKIVKYSGKNCVRCKLLDKILKHMNLEDVCETIYMEDEGEQCFIDKGIMTLPTIIISKNNKDITLSGQILPQDITDAIKELE